ncbi:MAG TPA: radical SAM protein [Polyangiaceae bacterium]|jgi:MoaA/NifB/PqqE/SkfB family radical SAM enzyme
MTKPHWALARPLEQLAVELTVYCNLQCKMCSVWELREHGVPTDIAKQMLSDAHALGARTFIPCGAESFMRKDFLDIVEHAHALGYTTQEIVTNGTMITDAHLDRLEKTPSVQLHVSIDGPPAIQDELRGEGVYEKSMRTVREAVKRGIRIGLSGVIMRETMATLEHIVDLAVEHGIGEVSYQPFQTEISGPNKDIPRFSLVRKGKREEIKQRLDEIRAYAAKRNVRIYTESLFPAIPGYLAFGERPIPAGGCYLPSKFLLVDWRGDVYPCFFMREDKMGNVYKDRIPDIWHSPIQKQLNVLALTARCPGCLAACSDVETANQDTAFVTAKQASA